MLWHGIYASLYLVIGLYNELPKLLADEHSIPIGPDLIEEVMERVLAHRLLLLRVL